MHCIVCLHPIISRFTVLLELGIVGVNLRHSKLAYGLIGLTILGACATAIEPVPAKRPMSAENAAIAGKTDVAYIESNDGVGKAWFYTSSAGAGASYGLIGAITTAVIDAIVNAGPSKRATRVADELEGAASIETINNEILAQLREEIRADGETAAKPIIVTEVRSEALSDARVFDRQKTPTPAALQLKTAYTLSEDASTLKVEAFASYSDPATPWRTPYQFKKSVPSDQLTGPAYRNRFTYVSDSLPIPTFTPETKERLIEAVETAAKDASGNLPAEGSNEYKSYTRELERARDDTFSKDEIALFLTVQWTANNGENLRKHLTQAHDFIARYLVLDINDPTVPSFTGADERIETLAQDRTIRRVGSGVEAGAYVSSPGQAASFVTYGNTVNRSTAGTARTKRLNTEERARKK
jgi:hypothetical protein